MTVSFLEDDQSLISGLALHSETGFMDTADAGEAEVLWSDEKI